MRSADEAPYRVCFRTPRDDVYDLAMVDDSGMVGARAGRGPGAAGHLIPRQGICPLLRLGRDRRRRRSRCRPAPTGCCWTLEQADRQAVSGEKLKIDEAARLPGRESSRERGAAGRGLHRRGCRGGGRDAGARAPARAPRRCWPRWRWRWRCCSARAGTSWHRCASARPRSPRSSAGGGAAWSPWRCCCAGAPMHCRCCWWRRCPSASRSTSAGRSVNLLLPLYVVIAAGGAGLRAGRARRRRTRGGSARACCPRRWRR